MTTATTIEQQTPAEQRKAKATHHLETLTTKLEQLKKRKETAACDVGRLCDEIVKAERAGTDPKALSALRRDRTEAESVGGDLDRVCSQIEAELIPAQGEFRDATIACCADRYNELVDKQRALQEVISEAIDTLAQALRGKEGLAQQQRAIQLRDMASLGFQSPERSPEDLRHVFLKVITERLTNPKEMNAFTKSSTMQKIDWPSWKMRADGTVEEA